MKLMKGFARLLPPYRSGNFITDADESETALAEDTTLTVRWSYTVPSGKRGKIIGGQASVLAEVAATSSTTTDTVAARITIDTGVQTVKNLVEAHLNSNSYAAGDRDKAVMPHGGLLDEGDVIAGKDIFEGDAAGAGVVQASVLFAVAEFDV